MHWTGGDFGRRRSPLEVKWMSQSPAEVARNALVGLLAFVLMFGVFSGLFPGQLSNAVLGGVAGMLAGVVPYVIAQRRTGRKHHWVLAACALSGIILGLLLAVPVAILLSAYFWMTTSRPS
jgi:hypothetical protein